MQTKQVRVRLNEDNAAYLRRLADESGLQPIAVATMALHSALTAMRETNRVTFPVRFHVVEAIPERPQNPIARSRR